MHGKELADAIEVFSVPAAPRRLGRDLLTAAATLSIIEVRYLVNAYYAMQEYRKAGRNQISTRSNANRPHAVITWLNDQNAAVEKQIKRVLDAWTDSIPIARWAKGAGIGPVVSAGIAAHIDMVRCPTVGHIWRFAGLDPTQEREQGANRTWNPDLKTLCWKIGESFAQRSGDDVDFYGRLYLRRKVQEEEANAAGELADQARTKLERFNLGKNSEAYKWYSQGKLPPDHIQARAKRWAVKLFLSHYHEVALRLAGQEPPMSFAITILNHAHYIAPPNF